MGISIDYPTLQFSSMLKYLLDTSTCIELLRGNVKVHEKCIDNNSSCCISPITAIEQLYGAFRAPEKQRHQEIEKAKLLVDYYTLVGIDNIAEAFSQEKIRLEKAGSIIEDFDLLIGLTAREKGLIVVTHNPSHFSCISRPKWVDWA